MEMKTWRDAVTETRAESSGSILCLTKLQASHRCKGSGKSLARRALTLAQDSKKRASTSSSTCASTHLPSPRTCRAHSPGSNFDVFLFLSHHQSHTFRVWQSHLQGTLKQSTSCMLQSTHSAGWQPCEAKGTRTREGGPFLAKP